MFLYFCDNYKIDEKNSLSLACKALNSYAKEKELDVIFFNEDIKIGEKGKPYIDGYPIEYSVSHCQNLWICAINDSEIGIDIEKIRKKDYLKLAKRYFTSKEIQYIQKNGEEAFFQIWTIKEACTKLFGESMFQNISHVEAVKEDKIVNKIGETFITDVSLVNGVKCSVATHEKDSEICIRMIK